MNIYSPVHTYIRVTKYKKRATNFKIQLDNGGSQMQDSSLKRFGVSMEGNLLRKFDDLVKQKGYENRSEAVRDLVREAIVQQTWGATAVILREAQTLGIDTQFIGLNQAVGEGLIDQAGPEITEGFMGTLTHALPYEDVPGMDEYKEYLDEEGIKIEDINMQHVAGWVSAKVMIEGIKKAAEMTDGEITGVDLLAGLESLEDFDTGGLSAPVTFNAESHAGTEKARLGIVVDGKWEELTDYFSYKE